MVLALAGPEAEKTGWFNEQLEVLKEKWKNDRLSEKNLKIYCVQGGENESMKAEWIR